MTAQEGWTEGPGLLASAWRYKLWIMLAAVLAGIAGYIYSSGQPPEYSATVRLFLADERDEGQFGTIPGRNFEQFVPQQAALIESRTVTDEIADRTGRDLDAIGPYLDVSIDVDRGVIEITGFGDTGTDAAELANAASNAYQVVSAAEISANAAVTITQLQQRLDVALAQLELYTEQGATDTLDYRERFLEASDLQRQIDNLRQDAVLFGSGVDQVTPAAVPDSPDSPKPKRDAVMFALLASGLATAVAYGRAGRPASHILDPQDAARTLGAPLLGTLPVYDHPDGVDTLAQRLTIDAVSQESYHFLLSSILHELEKRGGRRLLVTSANPGDGKTEVSLQLAGAAVLEGKDPLLVDGDLRVQQLSQLCESMGTPGLIDTADRELGNYADLFQRLPIYSRGLTLKMMSAGSPTDAGAGSIRLPGVVQFFDRAAMDHDLIVVDSAPILATADTTVLSSYTDALVVVIRKGLSLHVLEQVTDRLKFVNCEVLGYIFVSPDRADHGGTQAYGYGPYGQSAYPMAASAEPSRPRLRDGIAQVVAARRSESTPSPMTPKRAAASPVEASPVEPSPVEPSPVEASPVEPSPVEPSPVEASPVEPSPVEASPVEPTPVEASPVEPSPVEPSPVEASPVEPSPVEDSPVEPSPDEASADDETSPATASTDTEPSPFTGSPDEPSPDDEPADEPAVFETDWTPREPKATPITAASDLTQDAHDEIGARLQRLVDSASHARQSTSSSPSDARALAARVQRASQAGSDATAPAEPSDPVEPGAPVARSSAAKVDRVDFFRQLGLDVQRD